VGRGEIKRLETPESRDEDKKHDAEPPLWSALLKLHICISFMLTMSPEANYRYPCFLDEVQRSRVTRLREQSWAMQSPCPAWASSRTTGGVCTFLRTFRLKLERHPDGLAEEGTGVPSQNLSCSRKNGVPVQPAEDSRAGPHRTRSKAIVRASLVSHLSCQRKKLLFRDGGGGWQISGDSE